MIWDKDKSAIVASRFHAHLDECQQCEAHPFDLCSIGRRLLAGFVVPGGKPAKRSHVILADDDGVVGFVSPLPPEPRR